MQEKKAEQEEKKRKRLEKEALGTFGQLVESYVAEMRSLGKASAKEVERSLEKAVFNPFPNLRRKKAREVTPNDIKAILAQMINNGITTQTNRVRSYLMAAFNHGMRQENNPRTYLEDSARFRIEFNPVVSIPRQADFEAVGDNVLSDVDLWSLWHELLKTPHVGVVISSLVRFTLAMGGQRIKQVLATPWERYDLEQKTMEIWDSKGKGGNVRVHLVPLNDLALSVLEELMPDTGHCVYPFAGGLSGSMGDKHIRADSIPLALSRYREHSGRSGVKAADIRRTCKTIMARSGIPKEMRDRVHNHALNDIATKHYDRHDYLEEKRLVMEQWNGILENILFPKDNVVSFSKPL